MMGHRFPVWLSQKILPGWHEHLVSRTRFIRDSINETEQYVILGAGYDAKVNRLDFPHPLRAPEVDQSKVQERKCKKLPDATLDSPIHNQFVWDNISSICY